MKKIILTLFLAISLSFSGTTVFASGSSGGKAALNAAAQTAVQAFLMGAAMNSSAGSMWGSMCGTKTPYPCVLAAISISAAMAFLGDAGGAKDADAASSFNVGSLSDYMQNLGDPLLADEIKKIEGGSLDRMRADLAKKGVTFDEKTGKVTTPNGVYDGAALSSGASMASAGLIDEAQIEEVDQMMAKVNAAVAAKKFSTGPLVAGGGGGGGGYGSRNRGPASVDNPFGQFGLGLAGAKGKPKVAGLQKMFNGEAIGVKADNIFEMVRRKYTAKNKENFFAK
ncbi:MAG: hypothetical protein KDD59_01265 [Bdellovibrionales bacterium]|nr:hypothetical protein [Bdellovibrionales bacterium]